MSENKDKIRTVMRMAIDNKAIVGTLYYVALKQLEELEAKAAKWDMIQWAIDEQVPFVCAMSESACFEYMNKNDIKRLEQLYKERKQDDK